jgi:hypothetical protein
MQYRYPRQPPSYIVFVRVHRNLRYFLAALYSENLPHGMEGSCIFYPKSINYDIHGRNSLIALMYNKKHNVLAACHVPVLESETVSA